MKNIFLILQTLIFIIIAFIGYILPFQVGSALGGLLMMILGYFAQSLNRIAYINLQIAFPKLNKQAKSRIISSMWSNLGRNLFEYFRLPYQSVLNKKRYQILGIQNLQQIISEKKGGIFFSAHYGNWELGTFIARKHGIKIYNITRFLNNPFMRYIVNKIHSRLTDGIIPKGNQGARKIIQTLRNKDYVSMLMDQKLDEGVAIPFFGKNAMTASAIAKLAVKFQIPILPFQVIRKKECNFSIQYYPPIYAKDFANNEIKILKQVNKYIETWIINHPEQWFWVHKRWNKNVYIRR